MRTKNLIYFCLIFVFLFSLSFSVLGQQTYRGTFTVEQQQMAEQTKYWFNYAIEFLLGTAIWTEVIVSIAVLIILATAFSDIISNFSAFSHRASYVIGISLAVIMSVVGATRAITMWLLTIVGGFGAFTVVFALFVTFLIFFLIHWVIFGVIFKVLGLRSGGLSDQEQKAIKKGAKRAGVAAEALAKLSEHLRRGGR